jgi:dTDP-4-dehydrorhamnose 3,5-epimerase
MVGTSVRIVGLHVRNLESHVDDRGMLTEIFRNSWYDHAPVQWNFVRSERGTLRGVHGHFRHQDYLLVLQGSATIGLKDIRPGSESQHCAETILLEGEIPQVLTIPAGVAHGFYFHQPSTMVYGVTHYWDTEDELGCQWNDPELGISWPCDSPLVSERDARLPGFALFCADMKERLESSAERRLAG